MSSPIYFSCPQCGAKVIKISGEPKSIDDLNGASCASCGHTLNRGEIEKQLKDFARVKVMEALKRSKGH